MALIGVDREPMTDAAWRKKVRIAFAGAPSAIGDAVSSSESLPAGRRDLGRGPAAGDRRRRRVASCSTSPCLRRSRRRRAPRSHPSPCPAGHRARAGEAVRNRSRQRAIAQPAARDPRARGAGVPRRPLPRQVDRARRARAALRQPSVRTADVGRAHRTCRDRLRGEARAGGTRRLLRPGRRADRHDPEPPAAGARARRHGGAVRSQLRGAARRHGATAARRATVEARRHRRAAAPATPPATSDGRDAAVLPAGARRRPHARDRDPRRDGRRDRQLALGRRAVHPAVGQGHRQPAAGDHHHPQARSRTCRTGSPAPSRRRTHQDRPEPAGARRRPRRERGSRPVQARVGHALGRVRARAN